VESSFEVASIERDLERRLPSLEIAYRAHHGDAAPKARGLGRGEVEAVGAVLLGLQRGLTGSRALAGAPYMDDPGLLGAYLLYYWPVSYVQASLALAELGLAPRRVLDLGSGPGPAAAAAIDAGRRGGIEPELILADGSGRALDLAKRVLGAGGGAPGAVELDLESEPPLARLRREGGFDLVLLGHCLNELWRGQEDRLTRRLALLEAAASLLAPGGALLALEPALLATSREALVLRDGLAARGYPILGPCPGAAAGPYPCPALAAGPDRTCHAEAAWDPPEPVASLAAAAGLDRRSVKMAWFAVGARSADAAGGAAAPGPRDALRGRVVSDPMLNKAGRLRFVICSEGALVAVSARRDDPAAGRSGFLDLRRGDRVAMSGLEARPGGGSGFSAGSRLELLAKAPSPGREPPRDGPRGSRP
jgi:SAM-dependent methyltransferase